MACRIVAFKHFQTTRTTQEQELTAHVEMSICESARPGLRPSGFQPYRDREPLLRWYLSEDVCCEDPVHAGGEERRAPDGLGVEGTGWEHLQ